MRALEQIPRLVGADLPERPGRAGPRGRALLARRGSPSLTDVFNDRERHGDLFDLCEALLDHDEAFALWRSRHVLMVERQIGAKTGSGGSTGAQYLRTTLGKRFYPELWEVRSRL